MKLAPNAAKMRSTEAHKASGVLVNYGDLALTWRKTLDKAMGVEQKLLSILLMKSG